MGRDNGWMTLGAITEKIEAKEKCWTCWIMDPMIFPYHGGDPIFRPQLTFLLRSGGKTIEPGVVIFRFFFFFPLCAGYLVLCNNLAYAWDSSVSCSWFVFCGGNFDSWAVEMSFSLQDVMFLELARLSTKLVMNRQDKVQGSRVLCVVVSINSVDYI